MCMKLRYVRAIHFQKGIMWVKTKTENERECEGVSQLRKAQKINSHRKRDRESERERCLQQVRFLF